VRLVQVEHQLVGLRMFEGEVQIGLAHRRTLRLGAALGVGECAFQRPGEPIEAIGPHGGQDVFLVGEVAIGRHRADPKFGGQLAHGHRVRPLLGEQLFGDVAKALAEVGDIGL